MNEKQKRLKIRKTPIEAAVNVYIGNYCHRKCFKRQDIFSECMEKFSILVKEMSKIPITFKELKNMIDNDQIKTCKLPLEKRRIYVSWKEFEYFKNKDADFWDNK